MSKRQVLTARFCSARKERGFFFSFFPFGFLKSVHEYFFSYFSRWTNRWDTTATWNVRGGRWRLRLAGRAIPDSPIAVFMQLPWHLSMNLTGWVPLGELVTGANKHYQGWLQYKEKPWIFKNTFWSQILVWLKSNHRAENWRKTELKCGKLFSTRWSNAGSPKCSPTSLTPLWTPCPCPSSTKPWTKGIERENAQRKKCKEAEGQKFRED